MAEPRWRKMRRGTINPAAQATLALLGDAMDEVWYNDLYECQVRYCNEDHSRGGIIHLSIKSSDRAPIRDWRHFQAIKNDVAGREREAMELFPAESRLVDQANQYHLWVFPVGERIPIGWNQRVVQTHEDASREVRRRGLPDGGKARQRPWQPGITTGPAERR